MPVVQDSRYTQTAVAGAVNTGLFMREQAPEASPGTIDVLAAAARQSTLAGAGYERLVSHDPDLPDAPPHWDPLDHVAGFEDYASDLADAQTPSDLEGRKQRIRGMQSDREVLHRAGFGGVGAELGFSLLDPSFYVAAAVPEVTMGKSVALGKTLTAVARGAAGAGAYETGLQQLQESRSAADSALNIAGGALLSGVLGNLLHRIPASASSKLRTAIDEEAALVRSEAGAAAVARPTTLEAESIARGAKGLSGAMAKTPFIGTDLDKVMASESVTARTALQDLADVPQMLEKNKAGIATPHSVEAAVARHDARVADFMDLAREQWKLYRDRVPRGTRMSKEDFYTSIASAGRRGDTIGIAEVDEAAKFLRSRVFDPLKEEAQKLGLMVDPVEKAQQAAEKAAVDAYFSAQERQLFGDYQARTRAAITEGKGLAGDAAEAGSKADQIRTELERALSVEEGIKTQTLGDSGKRVEDAQTIYDTATANARHDLEATFTAARQDAEALARNVTQENLNRSDQLSLATDIEKSVRDTSISNATNLVEDALRQHQKLSLQVRQSMPWDKARIEILKSKLRIEGVRREVAAAIRNARRQFTDNIQKLTAQYGAEKAPKVSDSGTSRALRDFRRIQREARRDLEKARAAEEKTSRIERRRFGLAARSLKKEARSQIEDIEVSKLADFRKRAENVTRGEADADPAIIEMAKLINDRTRGKLASRVTAKSVDLEKAARPVGAESYFRRMYDRDVIRANLAEWHDTLFRWFSNQGKAEAHEITAAVEDVTRKILHADVGQANFATQVTVPAAGPLKERTLDIPDALIEKFLINDPTRVARAYVRELAPQVEMAKRFGDVDMQQQRQSIADEYNIKREAVRAQEDLSTAAQSKELKRLTDQEKATLEALVRIRDRVLGRAGRLSPTAGEGERRAVMANRNWRNFVTTGKMGGTAITGGSMDLAKTTAQYGFLPTMKKLTQLVRSKEFRDLSNAQARRAGSAVEVALSRRVMVVSDGAITEGWTQKLADGLYKYTGLSHITDFTRTLSATLFEDSVLKAATKVSQGKSIGAFERSRLASLGLGDEELAGIAQQIEQHGGEVGGIRVSGSADWTDKRLADIYDAAILKESKITVQQPGAADRVWWMDKETGKLIGQLKTFSLSAPTRLLAGGLQMAGHREYARAARYFGFMMIGGYLVHSLRQVIAGKIPTTDPQTAAFEALTESGIAGVFPDLISPMTRRLGILGESVRYADRNPMSAYGGPAVGAIMDTWDVAYNRTAGGLSASDLHALRRLLPYQNVWWLRREINALEGELAEGLDLKGADVASLGERIARTEAMKPKGGTLSAQNSGVQ